MSTRDKLLHPATFIALAALFVSLGGVGYAAARIGTKQLKKGAVTSSKLAKNSVTAPKIRAGAVGNSDLAGNAVSGSKIQGGAVGNSELAGNSVSASKIQAGAVGSSELAQGSVLNGELANGVVTSNKLAAGSVLGANLGDGAVTATKIANGAVSGDKLGAGAVTASKLAAGSVTSPAIAPNSVTAAQIAPGQVVEGNGTVSSARAQLANGTTAAPLLSFPGLGALRGNCSAAGIGSLDFVNATGAPVSYVYWGVSGSVLALSNGSLLAGNTLSINPNGVALGVTIMVSFGTGADVHLVTINASILSFPSCLMQAQATYTG